MRTLLFCLRPIRFVWASFRLLVAVMGLLVIGYLAVFAWSWIATVLVAMLVTLIVIAVRVGRRA